VDSFIEIGMGDKRDLSLKTSREIRRAEVRDEARKGDGTGRTVTDKSRFRGQPQGWLYSGGNSGCGGGGGGDAGAVGMR
jgi:hypothetical protein